MARETDEAAVGETIALLEADQCADGHEARKVFVVLEIHDVHSLTLCTVPVFAEPERRVVVVILPMEVLEIRTALADGLHRSAWQAVVHFEMTRVGCSPGCAGRRSHAHF